ncbi:MAG TPA: S41 family peptidase, partial [Candidatus Xenobia bacterium]
SRSAKEIYAFGLQQYHHGTLVGTTTAGDVRGAEAFYLDDGELLYLAISAVKVDGVDLEHQGVTPDLPVPRPIPYADGADPPYQSALGVVRHMLSP